MVETLFEHDKAMSMSNIVRFLPRSPTSSVPPSQQHKSVASVEDAWEARSARASGLQIETKEQIRAVILILDLAVQHARRVADSIRDPTHGSRFRENLSLVEALLEEARDRARGL